MGLLKRALRQLFERLTDVFDLAFGPRWNPILHIGALGWFYYWIVAATGIYLFVFFDTGISAAYESVERITHAQRYAGGVMRSLHRYASDALVLMMMLHLAREFAYDRLRGRRWFAWITGVPLLWLVLASGISGYWLVWDRLAQYVAIATTEWLDALPVFGESIARNFLDSSALGERFFTLMVFIHIFVPLALLFAMWIHVQRHAQSRIHAPRGLAAGTLAMMVVLSLVRPALSQGPADLDTVPASIGLDWYYLAVYPLLDRLPGLTVWAIVGGATLLLALMPWLPPMRKPALAVVHLTDCNGCGRCNSDCPFTAITMKARSDGLPYELEAVVDPGLCMSCGICAGACPTATPFRSASALVPGIELEDQPVAALRESTARAGASLSGPARVIVFSCGFGAEVEPLAGPSVGCVRVPCVAALPPSFIDFVISRHHAEGVMLAGCREGDCHYRLGQHWTEARVAGTRDPHLRARVPRERLCVHWAGPGAVGSRRAALDAFRERLQPLGPWRSAAARAQEVPDA